MRLATFIAYRLIPPDKNPGVRPIGIAETVRCIVGKETMVVAGPAIQTTAGTVQLCAGQSAGCKAAVPALCNMFAETNCEGIIMVDASNALKSLNRAVALCNI